MLLAKILTVGFLLGAFISAYAGVKLIIRSTQRSKKLVDIAQETDNDDEIDFEKLDHMIDQLNVINQLSELLRNNNIDFTSNLNEEVSSLPEEPPIIKPKLTVVK